MLNEFLAILNTFCQELKKLHLYRHFLKVNKIIKLLLIAYFHLI